jgi:Rhodopirellula transposase DDE domain
VESIRRWWANAGERAYPDATRLLITADSGGSNGARPRLWKVELAKLAEQIGLDIVMAHPPPAPANGTG